MRIFGRGACDVRVWAGWLVLWLVACGSSPLALADGKVLPPVLLPQEVAMPDQRALLAWHEGVQTLVIESAFVGHGTDFAWVVPLPTKPEVESATRGTLASAAALMQPVVVPPQSELGWLAAAILVVALWTLVFGWRSTGRLLRVAMVAGMGAMVGGVLTAIFGFGWLLIRFRRRGRAGCCADSFARRCPWLATSCWCWRGCCWRGSCFPRWAR